MVSCASDASPQIFTVLLQKEDDALDTNQTKKKEKEEETVLLFYSISFSVSLCLSWIVIQN